MSNRKKRASSLLAISVSALAIAASPVAWAEDSKADANKVADANKNESADDALQEIIVTGVTTHERKYDASFTIDTIDQAEIQRLAPISTADLLNNIPGFFAEGSTAGERSNNVTVRGLPSSGYRYAPQLVDGMPVFQDSDVPFANSDVFFSNDLMTDRVEAIKGGPGAILYANGLGGVVNYITKTGGDHIEGGYKIEEANYGYIRNDLYVAGPLSDSLHFALGGFYRTSDGLRDTGYTADKGGQIRGNLTYKSDDGKTNVGFFATILNDRTAIYNNLPFEVPKIGSSGTIANPVYINSSTVQPIGINFQNGTLLSRSSRYVTQVDGNGQTSVADLADGEHPSFTTLGAKFSKELDGGWKVSVDANYVDGNNGFNALFAGNDAATAASFLNDRYVNDFLQPGFDANWQQASGTPLNSSFYNRNVLANYFNALSPSVFQTQYQTPILNAGFSNFNQLRAQYGNLQTIGGPGAYLAAFNTSNGQPIAANSNLSFEIPWIVQSKLTSETENLRVEKDFDLFGTHHLTFGGYHSTDADTYNFQSSLTISTLASPAQLVDVYLVNAAGSKIAPLSLAGSYLPSLYGNAATGDAENKAGYLEDHWETLDHKLRIDAGFRRETEKLNVKFQNRNVSVAEFPGGTPNGNRALASIQALGAPQYTNQGYDGNGWSIGANYSIARNWAVYGLVSRSFRLPSFNDGVSFAQSPPLGDPVEHISQYEGGVRYHSPIFDVSAVGFYNKFTPRTFINQYNDINAPGCVSGTNVAACPLVSQAYSYGSTNLGTELELDVRPPFIRGFEIKVDATFQNPKVNGSSYTINNIVNNVQVLESVTQDGRREARQAANTIFIRPSWDMLPLTKLPLKLYADYEHRSSRFSTSQDVNVTIYPAYYILNAGVLWDITHKMSLQFHVANLTNQLSFTEGDPVNSSLLAPDGLGNRGVARPLFGRTERVTFNYRF